MRKSNPKLAAILILCVAALALNVAAQTSRLPRLPLPGHTQRPDEPRNRADIVVTGLVLCQNGDPVSGCSIQVTLTNAQDPTLSRTFTGLTDARGLHRIAIPCMRSSGAELQIQVDALCCGGHVGPVALTGCSRVFTFDNITCQGTEIAGNVLCEDQTPVASCDVSIQVTNASPPPPPVVVRTDANGAYKACILCSSSQSHTDLQIDAMCCGASTTVGYDECPDAVAAPDILCTCRTNPCGNDETLLKGRIMCPGADPAQPPRPKGDCAVHIEIFDLTTNESLFVGDTVTDANGCFSLCVPCHATPTKIVITPACCSRPFELVPRGCAPETPVGDIPCDCNPPTPPPCPDPGQTHVSGTVTFMQPDPADPNRLIPAPMSGCTVTMTTEACGTQTTYTLTTDADGRYQQCVPCNNCSQWRVEITEECCAGGPPFIEFVPGCPPEFPLPPINCGPCQ